MRCFVSLSKGGRSNPSVTFRCVRLLRSPAADVRCSDDVIAFEGPLVVGGSSGGSGGGNTTFTSLPSTPMHAQPEWWGPHHGNGTNSSGSNSTATIRDIERLYFIEAIAGAAGFLLILLYFPSRPPQPPTLSSELKADGKDQNLGFFEGLRQLVKTRNHTRHGEPAGVLLCSSYMRGWRNRWPMGGTVRPSGVAGAAHQSRRKTASFGLVSCTNPRSNNDGACTLSRLKSSRFWALALAFGIPLGISSGWNAVLAVNLVQPGTGFTDDMVGWLGFWMTLAGCAAGIGGGWVAGLPFARRRKKRFVLWIYIGASISLTLFSLACIDIIPREKSILYVTAIAAGICLNAPVPMFFELCVEETYPLPESTSVGVLVLLLNLVQSLFLFIPMKQVGHAWCNWTLTGSMVLFTAVLLPLKEDYKRLNVDETETAPKEKKRLLSKYTYEEGDGSGSINKPLLM